LKFNYKILIYLVKLIYILSTSGKAIISGHADGSIVRYIFESENNSETQVKIC
jgi:hypothetical protein